MNFLPRIRIFKGLFALITVTLLLLCCAPGISAREEIKVMVAPFTDSSGSTLDLEKIGRQKLVRLLDLLRYFSVTKNRRMMNYLKEVQSAHNAPDLEAENPNIVVARKAGVDYLFTGTIVESDYKKETLPVSETRSDKSVSQRVTGIVTIDLRIVDVEKEKTLFYHAVKGVAHDESDGRGQLKPQSEIMIRALTRAIEQLWPAIQTDFPLSGIIIKKEKKAGDYLIYVDFGLDRGVDKKRTLSFYQNGDKIIHPVTGHVLSSGKGDLITTGKLSEIYREYAISRMSRRLYKKLEVGMIVEASPMLKPHETSHSSPW